MLKAYKSVLLGLVGVFAFGFVVLAFPQPTSAQTLELKTFFSYHETKLDQVNQQALWNIVSDLRNDSQYWPNINDAVIVQMGSGGVASPGTVYDHTGEFAGVPFANEITVVSASAPWYLAYEARSLYVAGLEYIGIVATRPALLGGGSVRMDTSVFKTAGEMTPELFEAYQDFGLTTSFLAFMNSTGKTLVNYATDITDVVGDQPITWDLLGVSW